ncbi:MAG TPA: (Fe-S)-binding protein, partial [Rhodobacteraceae bacterium]|nr:(Fe-S)-binding protein [Paracoccaceae bacterium]
MTQLPANTERKLGLVIDLDTCVGCHACVVSCKGWNTENYGAPLSDTDAYGGNPLGTFLNRVHSYEVTTPEAAPRLVHFPKSCLHCEDAP